MRRIRCKICAGAIDQQVYIKCNSQIIPDFFSFIKVSQYCKLTIQNCNKTILNYDYISHRFVNFITEAIVQQELTDLLSKMHDPLNHNEAMSLK